MYKREDVSISNVVLKSKWYKVCSPLGNVEVIFNMREFCRKNNLHQGAMIAVSKGKASHHKQFTCQEA
jgi:hypothetical protein